MQGIILVISLYVILSIRSSKGSGVTIGVQGSSLARLRSPGQSSSDATCVSEMEN